METPNKPIGTLGKVLWVLFGGINFAAGYFFIGLLLYITIIGIPAARYCFKCARLALMPFDREIVDHADEEDRLFIGNVVWLILFGIGIAVSHLFYALFFAITIVGWRFAKMHAKLAGFALMPFGKEVKPTLHAPMVAAHA